MCDIVMLRCRAECKDAKNRDEFLGRAAEGYGGGKLDKEVRAQVLQSYHKDRKNQKCRFVSNNQIAAVQTRLMQVNPHLPLEVEVKICTSSRESRPERLMPTLCSPASASWALGSSSSDSSFTVLRCRLIDV